MNVVVLDDRGHEGDLAVMLVQRAFPSALVVMKGVANSTELGQALRDRRVTPEGAVALVDLALGEVDNIAVDGTVARCESVKILRPDLVFVAYTRYGSSARIAPGFERVFSGVLDKSRLERSRDVNQKIAEVRGVLEDAISAAAGKPSSWRSLHLQDSIGLRLTIASLGEAAIRSIVNAHVPSGSEATVRALTGGGSGASVLELMWRDERGRQSVIIKCARLRSMLEGDIGRPNDHLGQLGTIGTLLSKASDSLQALPNDMGYYYVQECVPGDSLLNRFRDADPAAENALRSVANAEREHCEAAIATGPAFRNAAAVFPLQPLDTMRALDSLTRLEGFGGVLGTYGTWPANYDSAAAMCETVRSWVMEWQARVEGLGDIPVVLQHGDLNPGNVMVGAGGQVALIDPSRLGLWPPGYDLSRLSLMLRLRLVDGERSADWVVNRLAEWSEHPFCIDREWEARGAGPWEVCDAAVVALMIGGRERGVLGIVAGVAMGRLWDLVKLLSYVDLSPYKRLLVLGACWELCERMQAIDRG